MNTESEKISDNNLKKEVLHDFSNRMFNQWHKWKKSDKKIDIKMPSVDDVTKNTLIYITNAFPDITERYSDFLQTLNIDFDGQTNDLGWTASSAEKYIISLKLQRHLERLRIQRKEVLLIALSGDAGAQSQIAKIDADIKKYSEKLETLASI